MRRLSIHASVLLLALGPAALHASAQRAAGAAQRQAKVAPARQQQAPRAPDPALRELEVQQNRRRHEVIAFERVKGSAWAELERRRINAGLGASEPQVARFLLSEELLHRERVARLARLREIAVEARNKAGVAAVDQLARVERAQYQELLRTGTRRLSSVTQRELQTVLLAGRMPPPAPVAAVAKAAPKSNAQGNAQGNAQAKLAGGGVRTLR